jgi:uncharacterized protein (DUF1015 family)
MHIRSFRAIRPPAELAAAVASLPYDVGELSVARAEAAANARSFLHVERPEVDLPDGAGPEAAHRHAAEQLAGFLRRRWLVCDDEPSVFLYRLAQGAHVQAGFVVACWAEEYDAGTIRRHEKTKKPVEDERTLHVRLCNANTGPVYLIHRDDPVLARLAAEAAARTPLYDFTAPDGVAHTVWRVPAAGEVIAAFTAVPRVYIADGHHRAASAARVARERREANPAHRGDEAYNWILGVIFPASQLRILPYNRGVRDLNGLSPAAFLAEVRRRFDVQEDAPPSPDRPGRAGLYLGGRWYGLAWTPAEAASPVARLDVSVLQDRLLGPVLGVDDPRTSARMEYVGGLDSVAVLQRKVDEGRLAAGFSVFPTTIDDLLTVSDADQIMPPKSTWFEPKLRSGLFVRALD